jgi:peptidoglycan/xylan/chitin deacetylase (PgdA/CDA1 family)
MMRSFCAWRLWPAALLSALAWAAAAPPVAFASLPHRADTDPPVARIVRVPILMYHYIRINSNPLDKVGADLSVTPEQFALQMGLLARNGFHSISVDDLVAAIMDGGPLPHRPVVLTFDDGYEDFYTAAYPVLKQYGLGATSFIITGKVGRKGYLTWDQMRLMQAGGLVNFQSHTVDHVAVDRLSFVQAQHELVDSKAALDRQLGRNIDIFCYPSGRYNSTVEALLSRYGYIAGVGTKPGIIHNVADLEALTRIRIRGADALRDFAKKLGIPKI